MKKILIVTILLFLGIGIFGVDKFIHREIGGGGAPPYVVEDLESPDIDPYAWILDWARPEGPPRIGLQVGHWKNEELPEELSRLIGQTGSSGGGKSEAEVNMAIAEEAKKILEEKGIVVDILPATIPPKYWADAFIAIHADGSESSTTTGYKAASPRRDFSGNAEELVSFIETEYEKVTGLVRDPNVTRNMTGYYAFAWWRYEHAVHPMAAAAILETGFLTNPSDRRIIVNQPEISAEGLANGIIQFLESEKLLES